MKKIWSLVSGLLLIATPCYAQAVVMVAGGGSEGDIGDTTSWSYRLYPHLLDGGDVNGDGRITVAVLANSPQSSFIPQYFKWLGADDAFNVIIASRDQANNAGTVDAVRGVDAIFIKGGDQGVYYDLWNGTRLEDNIRYVVQTLNGGIGGTSAGAMSQSQYAFAGGKDLISLDILTNAQTPYLNDTDGGSGIHNDFLGFVTGSVIDSHFNDRGRLARLLGIMAKAQSDYQLSTLLGIGLGDQTGLAIHGNSAQVIGVGSVTFAQPTPQTVVHRPAGAPLYLTNIRADVLTEGWSFDLTSRVVTNRPADALPVSYAGDSAANKNALTIDGSKKPQERSYALKASYYPQGYSLTPTPSSTDILNSIGLNDSQNSNNRGYIQETILRALYDHPDYSGILLSVGGKITRAQNSPDLLSFGPGSGGPESAAVIFDGEQVSAKSLSPYVSTSDSGNGSLHSAALENLRVHVLGQTSIWGTKYDSRDHDLQ
ncbi:cyanophycinase [Gloeobacter kilaueensis]|uniref:Cyanophycinase n=1 Tax=Gloeobacter kilaueensis (strain ATCC BAA-2537 / CCAP 1431/1 / ULC 316 / JS1) TaxID=1183438 RepID=U5QDP7_GLOK1|nr:cyanophycinase [Gloeobacter kilaueensis]AGY57072.1 cyanophycinase [Gloeobacter kilaueensis JS1]